MALLDFLKPPPAQEEIEDQAVVKSRYRYWRLRIFYSMYIGYALYYFTRKSFVFAMPSMIAELGFDKGDLGFLGSIFAISYGLSKFLNGILADRTNPRYLMAFGLILTGVFNIFFGFSSSILMFAFFWGLNAWFQGYGWPPCARLLTHWYSQSERGRWWGIWNTSHNIGGALIPIIVGLIAMKMGWRYSMYIPGAFCILAGFYLINRLRDTPRSLGLPPIEKYRDDYPINEGELAISKKEAEEDRLSTKRQLLDFVLKNHYVWLLAFSYFFVYVIRSAVNDWGQLFLIEEKGFKHLMAGGCIFWFEIGGFFGSLAAGWLSDTLFKGRRGPVNALYCVGVVLGIISMWMIPFGHVVFASISIFMIGFLIFGPQMLIGVAAAELTHKKAAATSNGFVGWFGYLGAAAAGYPIGKITQEMGWYGYFVVLGVCGVLSVLLLFPLWSARTHPKLGGVQEVPSDAPPEAT